VRVLEVLNLVCQSTEYSCILKYTYPPTTTNFSTLTYFGYHTIVCTGSCSSSSSRQDARPPGTTEHSTLHDGRCAHPAVKRRRGLALRCAAAGCSCAGYELLSCSCSSGGAGRPLRVIIYAARRARAARAQRFCPGAALRQALQRRMPRGATSPNRRLTVDGKVIITHPCIFSIQNH
jgi:hypothetical protein